MILHKLPPFQNVGANQTAVMPLVHAGMSVVGIIFKLGGTTFTHTHFSNLRLRFDGKQFVDITGLHLDSICDYETYGASSSFLFLPFGDLQAKTQRGQMMGAVDTSISGIKPLEMEVDIGGATAPTLEAWVVLAPPKALDDDNKFTIRAYLKATHGISAAGEFSQPIPMGSQRGALIHRVYAFHSNVTKLQVAKDGLWLQQEGEEAVLDYQQALVNRANQSGLITFDPTFTDAQSDAIATMRPNDQPATFDFKFTTSASDTVVSYTSLYSTIDKI